MKKEIFMNNKFAQRKIISLLCAFALVLSVPSIVSATEGNAAVREQATENRPEPDAYFEPIQTNEIPGWPQGFAVWAESAVVMDIDSGAFLYAKNMDTAKYPASITKIMTVLLTIENCRLNERVTFSKNAIFGIERNSSHIGIRVGEILSVEDCLYGMMLESANEVCLAVAEHIGGSVEGFVAMMNQKAAELGCTNTNFTNPNGLPDENHYTTAHDMALIAQAAYKNPTFREVCRTRIHRIPTTNICGEDRWLNNHHKMLPEREYSYAYCTGGKTGYTQAALNTLVTYAERDGRRLVCVSLRTNGAQYYPDTASLLNYGFDNFQNITLYSRPDNAAAQMIYPSILFGQPCTLDSLRLTSRVTLPVSAAPEQVETTASLNDGSLSHTYRYNQYTVGSESIPDAAFRTLMAPPQIPADPVPPAADTPSDGQTDSSRNPSQELTSLQKIVSAAKQLPVYVYALFVLLLAVIVMEIILGVRKKKRRRKRRKKHNKNKKHKK